MDDYMFMTANGRRYKTARAYHIAMGMAVRYALLNFYKEVKQYLIQELEEWYQNNTGGSDYYDNTYGMINAFVESNDVDGAIHYAIRGSFEKSNAVFAMGIDWTELDAHSNGYGEFGTYTSFDGTSVVDNWDELLKSGLPIYPNVERKDPLDVYFLIDKYVDKRLDRVIDNVLEQYRIVG